MNYLSISRRKGRNVNSFLAFLLFVCLSVLPAVAQQDKNITLDVKNETVENVLKTLGQQAGLKFFYDQELVSSSPRVTIQVKNVSLQSILNQISSQTQLSFNRDNNTITVGKKQTDNATQTTASPNTLTVKGMVVDANGLSVIGANVVVKGTTNGVITDFDGNYTLKNVPADAVVSISYIGYQPLEFKAGSKELAKVVLKEDSEQLDEVVVVGYGTVKKRDLTGSVASVGADDISAVPSTTAVEALQGRASGVIVSNTNWSPGSSPSILIRGKRSINASNDPLFVVDGIPITGGIGEISPSDIESMEVLKDASATAIYGSRGANGVIIITTKSGKEGKTTIDYNGYVGIQTIQNKLDMMNGAEYAEYTREAYRNSTGSNKYLSDVPNKEQDMLLPMFAQDSYVLESVMMAYDENGNYDPSKIRSFNWFDEVTRTGIITDHQINIRGGGSKTNFMASATYNKIT